MLFPSKRWMPEEKQEQGGVQEPGLERRNTEHQEAAAGRCDLLLPQKDGVALQLMKILKAGGLNLLKCHDGPQKRNSNKLESTILYFCENKHQCCLLYKPLSSPACFC